MHGSHPVFTYNPGVQETAKCGDFQIIITFRVKPTLKGLYKQKTVHWTLKYTPYDKHVKGPAAKKSETSSQLGHNQRVCAAKMFSCDNDHIFYNILSALNVRDGSSTLAAKAGAALQFFFFGQLHSLLDLVLR